MHIDEALASIRKCASELGYSCKEGNITEGHIDCVYSLNDVNIKVWYNTKDDFFGFDMFQGGQKTYGNIDDFKKYVSLYMNINAVFVPTAKLIADKFEKELGVNSVYQNFKGNQDTGFSCYFNILNEENCGIKIKQINDTNYLAQYIVQDEEGSRIDSEKMYIVDDVGNIYVQVTIKDYIKTLYERYSNSESINIRRYGECDFEFDIDHKILINASVAVADGLNVAIDNAEVANGGTSKFFYIVHSAVDSNCKVLVEDGDVEVKLNDVFDLNSLADYFLNSTTDEEVSSSNDDFEYDDTDDDFEESEESEKEQISGMQEIIDEKKPKLSGLEDLVSNEDDFEETSAEEPEDEFLEDDSFDDSFEDDLDEDFDEEEPDEIDESDDENLFEEDFDDDAHDEPIQEIKENHVVVSEDTSDTPKLIEIKVILDDNGNKIGVRFSYSNKIYDMSLDAAKKVGLPVGFIQSVIVRKLNRGMLITDEELARKLFAEDVSGNIDLCKKLVNDFFI